MTLVRGSSLKLPRGSATRVRSAEMNQKVEHRQLKAQPK
jgi:hypothetical protein